MQVGKDKDHLNQKSGGDWSCSSPAYEEAVPGTLECCLDPKQGLKIKNLFFIFFSQCGWHPRSFTMLSSKKNKHVCLLAWPIAPWVSCSSLPCVSCGALPHLGKGEDRVRFSLNFCSHHQHYWSRDWGAREFCCL